MYVLEGDSEGLQLEEVCEGVVSGGKGRRRGKGCVRGQKLVFPMKLSN